MASTHNREGFSLLHTRYIAIAAYFLCAGLCIKKSWKYFFSPHKCRKMMTAYPYTA